MSQYASKLHIKVCSPDIWKRFEHADDAGLDLAKLAKAGRTSYINDIGDECSYTEFELKELVNTIAGTLGKDGIIIACTTDINVDPYYQDFFYLGDICLLYTSHVRTAAKNPSAWVAVRLCLR